MATQYLYDKGREGFLDGSIDWDTDDIRGAIVTSSYTPNQATDTFLSTPTANIVARTTAITAKTVAAGVANGTIPLMTVVTGAACIYFILFKHTGSDATARLIAAYDISYTPSGNDLQIAFSTGANKAFKL
jgi:hypothetical protein